MTALYSRTSTFPPTNRWSTQSSVSPGSGGTWYPKKVEQPRSALPNAVATAKFGVSLVGKMLSLNLPRTAVGRAVKILDVQGNVQMQKTAQSMNESLNVNTLKSGLYLVQVQGLSAKKFVVK